MSSSVSGDARDRLISVNLSDMQVYDGEQFSVVRQSNGQQGKTRNTHSFSDAWARC